MVTLETSGGICHCVDPCMDPERTTEQAAKYLHSRLQQICDRLSFHSRPKWSLADVTAIRALLDDRLQQDGA